MDGENQQLLSSKSLHHSDTHNYSAVRQWSLLISLLLLQFLTISIDTFLLPFFTEKALDKGIGEFQIGVIFSAYNLSRLLGATFFVNLIASRSPRAVCLTGGLLTSLACTAFGLAGLAPDGAWFFSLCLLIRLAAGIGSGMLTTTCTSVLLKSTSFTPSTIMAAMESMVGAGYATGPVFGTLLYKWTGYTASFMPLGALTLLSTIIAFCVVPDISKEETQVNSSGDHSYVRLMLLPGIMLMFLSATALKVACHGYAIFLSNFFIDKFSVDISIVGLVFAAGALCYTIASFISARLINKTGAGWSQMIASWFVITLAFLLMPPSPLLNFIFHGKRYFKPTERARTSSEPQELVDPDILIDEAFQREMKKNPKVNRRIKYNSYSEEERSQIGQYAHDNSTAAALKKFKAKYDRLTESTVRTWRDKYRESLKHGPKKLPAKIGRPLLLGERLDEVVKAKVKAVRDSAGIIDRHTVQCLGIATMQVHSPMLLKDNGGHIELTDSWARSLLLRMGFKKRCATTGKLQLPTDYVDEKKLTFLNEIGTHVKNDSIPADLILNWDQTPLHYVPAGKWTMEAEGASKVPIAGGADKRALTAIFTVSLSGEFLPMQLIYTGKTSLSLPKFKFPDGFSLTQNPSHWSNELTMELYIKEILGPYIKRTRELLNLPNTPALLIYDAFRAHTTDDIQEKLRELNVRLVMVPKNMTDHLQPLDISVNKPAKNYLKRRYSEWYTEKVVALEESGQRTYDELGSLIKSSVTLREVSASWISGMFEFFQQAPRKEIIINGFRHCGIKKVCEEGPVNDDPFADIED